MYPSFLFPVFSVFSIVWAAWSIPLVYILRALRLFPQPAKVPKSNLRNAVAIVTGSNTGIGLQTAIELCKMGATVIMANRSQEKTEEAIRAAEAVIRNASLEDSPNAPYGKLVYLHIDLADLKSVRNFATEFKKQYDHLDILVNNAGLNTGGKTKQGFEMQFCVNFLGHFMLTSLLLSHLRTTTNAVLPEGRIVNLSSVMHYFGQENVELSATGRYAWWQHLFYSYYSDSKLFMQLFTLQLNRIFKNDSLDTPPANQRNVIAASANPGFVRSDIWRNLWKPFLTYVWDPLMRGVALSTTQASSTSVAAALTPATKLLRNDVSRRFYESPTYKQGLAGHYRHPLIPYFVPYYVPPIASVMFEIGGPFAGPQVASAQLPSRADDAAQQMWQFCEAAIEASETTAAAAEASLGYTRN